MVTVFEQYTRVVRSYSCNVNFQSYYLQKLAILTLTRLNFIKDCTQSVDRRFRQHLFWNWSSITHGVVIWQHRLFVSLWRGLLSVVWKLYTKVEIGTYSLPLFCLQIDHMMLIAMKKIGEELWIRCASVVFGFPLVLEQHHIPGVLCVFSYLMTFLWLRRSGCVWLLK